MHHSKPRYQLSTLSAFIFYFFMHLLICFELNGPEIEKLYKWTLKRLKLGMVSSFHPHGMRKRVERVMAETGRTSCTNWAISFGASGFRTITHLLQGHFIFLTYLNSRLFSVPMHHSKRRHKFSTLSNIICYFQSFIDLFTELNDREIENHYKMNSENVETWHGIIISTT